MPNHYNPYNPYGYFKPTGKEQGAMAIGSLLAGLLASSQPRQRGEASPFIKGVAGSAAGFGDAYKNFLNIKGDQYGMDVRDRDYAQRLRQYNEEKAFEREKFEAGKPLAEAQINALGQRESRMPNLPTNAAEWEYMKDLKPSERSMFRKTYRPDKSPLTTVNVGAGETEEQKGFGKARVEMYQNIQKEADIAKNDLDIYSNLNSLMQQTTTGALEPHKTAIASYAQSLGIPVNEKWGINQSITAISNKLTVMARKVGEGQLLAGQISDADRDFLKASVPGLEKMENANEFLTNIAIKLAQRKIETAQFADEYYNENGTMKGFYDAQRIWVKNNPLFSDRNASSKGIQPPYDPFAKYWK